MAGRQASIEDHVTCPICMDMYDNPIALSCMHSFCYRCIKGMVINGQSFNCPECRTQVNLDKRGVDGLPKNFQLGSIVESYKKDLEEPPAPTGASKANYCRQHHIVCQILCKPCKQNVCVKCIVSDHDRHQLTYPPEGRVDMPEEFNDLVCKQHAKNYKLYCRMCEVTVCIDCIVQKHSSHSFRHMSDAHSQYMDDVNEYLSSLETRQRLLRATQKSCRVLAQKTQVDSQKKYQQIKSYFSRIRETMEKREEALRREITLIERQSVDKYLATADSTHQKEAEVQKVIDELRRLGTVDNIQFLKEYKNKQSRIDRLLGNEEDDTTPRHRSVDDATLQTQHIETELAKVQWEWKKEDIKPLRKAPPVPVPAKRQGKMRPVKQSQSKIELKTGTPVQRGKDWNDGNKDGGPGHFGTVVQITLDTDTYMIRWPNGNTGSYKYEPPVTEEVTPP